jgi:hypothetical protein
MRARRASGLSRATVHALRVVCRHADPIDGSTFARLMWPTSEGWGRISKAKRAGHAMPMRGGAFLRALFRRGLLREAITDAKRPPAYQLSKAGADIVLSDLFLAT